MECLRSKATAVVMQRVVGAAKQREDFAARNEPFVPLAASSRTRQRVNRFSGDRSSQTFPSQGLDRSAVSR